MDINFKQSQFELFPNAHQDVAESHKPKFFLSRITLNFENIIVLTIGIFIVMILSFSIGVERGKRIASGTTLDSEQIVAASAVAISQQDSGISKPVDLKTVSMQAQAAETPPAQQEILGLTDINHFTVQVASFKTKKYAEKEANALKQKGYDSFILPRGSHIIVCVGRFSSREEAAAFSYQLKNRYKDCFARRI